MSSRIGFKYYFWKCNSGFEVGVTGQAVKEDDGLEGFRAMHFKPTKVKPSRLAARSM